MESFAMRLKDCRKEKNLTQVQLAKALNVGNGVIADVERGARNPSKNLALILSDFFKTDIAYWLDKDKEVEKEIKQHTKYETLDNTIDRLINENLITDLNDLISDNELKDLLIDAVKIEVYIKLKEHNKK